MHTFLLLYQSPSIQLQIYPNSIYIFKFLLQQTCVHLIYQSCIIKEIKQLLLH